LLRYSLHFFGHIYNFSNSHESYHTQYVLYRARTFVVTTTHEPLKAHPKAARRRRRRLKRPVVVIARDTAAEEAVGPRIDGARAVEEVKEGAVLPTAKGAAMVKAIVRAVVRRQNHPSHEMRSGQEKRVSTTLVSL
jgi:hypothetical protein